MTNLGCVLDVGLVMSGHAARMCKSAPYLESFLPRKPFCRVTRTLQKMNILKVPTHGKGYHSMKTFSIAGPTMMNEMLTDEPRECTSVDVFFKIFIIHSYSLFLHNFELFFCYCIPVNTLVRESSPICFYYF